jgi:hypothetical protein
MPLTTEQKIVLGLGVGIVAIAAIWEANVRLPKRMGAEITKETLTIGMHNPPLWIFYNDSDVNSRQWYDFGARSSHVINIPLLNLTYDTIAKHNGQTYRIELLGGLTGVAELLGGVEALPVPMRRERSQITQPEEDWIRAAVLSKFGGLWVSPSVVCLKPFGKLPEDTIVAFGQDETPLYGSSVPGFRCLWVPVPNHPMMVEWERRCRARLEGQTGGRQVRGDAKSDWVELSKDANVEVRVREELGRDVRTNKKLELEDLLAAGTGGRLPFAVPESAIYVPIPYKDLLDRRFFGWILRSSEEQILESDIALRYLLERSL